MNKITEATLNRREYRVGISMAYNEPLRFLHGRSASRKIQLRFPSKQWHNRRQIAVNPEPLTLAQTTQIYSRPPVYADSGGVQKSKRKSSEWYKYPRRRFSFSIPVLPSFSARCFFRLFFFFYPPSSFIFLSTTPTHQFKYPRCFLQSSNLVSLRLRSFPLRSPFLGARCGSRGMVGRSS